MFHGYVPGVIWMHVTRDGIPQVAIVPPLLRTGTAVHVLFRLLSSIEGFSYYSLCSDHGLNFRNMS